MRLWTVHPMYLVFGMCARASLNLIVTPQKTHSPSPLPTSEVL
jgi:hypothetical protein